MIIYESEPDGISVEWDSVSGAVRVNPDGDWMVPAVAQEVFEEDE